MGSSESKQAAARLDAATLPAQLPSTLCLRAQSPLHLQYHLCSDEDDHDHSNNHHAGGGGSGTETPAPGAPLFLVSQPSGARGELVLYAGPSRSDAPLALVGPGSSGSGVSSFLRGAGAHSTVRLAPPTAGAQVIREELRARRRGVLGVTYGFAVAAPRREDGAQQQQQQQQQQQRLPERDSDDEDGDGDGGEHDHGHGGIGFDYGYGREEVVAVWAEVSFGRSLRKVAKFKFVGEGAGPGPGDGDEAWRAMAVVTFLRVWQLSSQAGSSAGAASSSSSAAATVIAAGV
ncbi:hypothetical protein ESCO_004367 [Escovopsis weberi]|uniref:Uncharacterized protein n=1 Tax=Escovopsis weberi TaxID=150374 RepID=A0A0M8MWY2_ESCWE|nr:hypothetical protein ESCO_004367 [Escovopsis weberi]